VIEINFKKKISIGTDLEELVNKIDEDAKEMNKEKIKEKKREETRQWSNISNIKDLKKLVHFKNLISGE
jgi:hypothetical protein